MGLGLFVETSALVAMLAGEAGSQALAKRLKDAAHPITSPLVILEAAMVLSTMWRTEPVAAETRIREALADASVKVVPIDGAAATLAVDAFARYGKGRGKPAKLNMSDCLSYACAKQHRVALLYAGNDFAATDLA